MQVAEMREIVSIQGYNLVQAKSGDVWAIRVFDGATTDALYWRDVEAIKADPTILKSLDYEKQVG